MKKEINSKSRRKWIMGGLAAFASVALLTTGFAVWVVGVTQTTKEGDVKVDVDTARNDNVTFDVELNDNTIALKEPKTDNSSDEHKNDFVKIENKGNEEQKTDFDISFKTFKITMPKNRYNQVKISFNTADDSKHIVDNNVPSDGDQFKNDVKLGDKCQNRTTYFELADNNDGFVTWDLTSDKFEPKEASGTLTYTLKETGAITLFQWGSFFGKKAPSEFYNKTLLADAADQTTENAEKVKLELDSMYNKYVKTGQNPTEVAVSLHFELVNSAENNN